MVIHGIFSTQHMGEYIASDVTKLKLKKIKNLVIL